MKNKIFAILFLVVLFSGLVSIQVNYSKCLSEDIHLKKQLKRSILGRILISFLPIGWVNWLTSYVAYEKEINCFINETNNLGYEKMFN